MDELNCRSVDDACVLTATRHWVERAVIGLNLCPFAKAVYVKNLVHFSVCHASSHSDVVSALREQIVALYESDPNERDTTLLVLPYGFDSFLEFTSVVDRANRLVRKMGLDGSIQIASFHPAYQFADARADDMGNYTNRAPYPTLHLLREESIDKAVAAFPAANEIFERNIRTMERLGREGWAALQLHGAAPQASDSDLK
ncbi:MAG: DUF1415 domain-containing protein [Rhodoferax sp.]|nr:DUF1415 domain-containing protein [Rhodoferax sp.]